MGKLRGKLEEVGLPIPVDATTGKAFEYSCEGMTARIASPAPEGDTRGGAVIVVTLKK